MRVIEAPGVVPDAAAVIEEPSAAVGIGEVGGSLEGGTTTVDG